jgi:hypothetical protein
MRKFLHIFLVSSFCIMLFGGTKIANAQDSVESYDGLDIVFLVDQSGSMGGNCVGCPFNDPLELRFYSLKYAMEWLGVDHLALHQDKMFRVAVVNFGSTAEAWDFNDASGDSQYWQEIAPVSESEWNTLFNKLDGDIGKMKDSYSSDDLGDTDFQRAFKLADELFGPKYLVSMNNHLRVVVVLSDGQPNPEQLPTDNISIRQYMLNLVEYVKINFPEPDYRIYVVGMPDEEDPYWSRIRSYWELATNDPCPGIDIACSEPAKDRASLVESNQDVGKRFLDILQDITSNMPVTGGCPENDPSCGETVILPGKYVVPPYLKTISFTYFKENPSEKLIIVDAQGKVVDPNQSGVTITGEDGPIQRVIINSPIPGRWEISTNPSGSNVKITRREIFAKSQLDKPIGSQVQYLPVQIQYALLDEVGAPLLTYKDPYYQLVVTAEVSLNASKWQLTLNSQPDNIYSANFFPTETGEYKIFVVAKSKDMDSKEIIVYQGEIGSFTVAPATLVPINLSTSWPQYEERDLIFGLRDVSGFAIPSAANEEIEITVSIIGPSGPDGVPIIMKSMRDGTFKGFYRPQERGEHIIQVLATLRDSSGMVHEIINGEIGRFNATATALVELKIVEPQSRDVVQSATGLWPFTPHPLIIQLELIANGNPVDPATVFVDPESAITADVQDADGQTIPNALVFKMQKTKLGLYQAETSDLGVGMYTIIVKAGELRPDYALKELEIPLRIRRIVNPALARIGFGTLIFLAIAIPSIGYVVVARRRRRQHPCSGRVYIVDGFGSIKFPVVLDSYQSNRVVFKTKDMPPITRITKMLFECRSDVENKSKQVNVTVWVDDSKLPIINNEPMRLNGVKKLGQHPFWLLKDPSDDQLMEVRSSESEL